MVSGLLAKGVQKKVQWIACKIFFSIGRVKGHYRELWDFHREETNDVYVQRIKDVFYVDVGDLAEKGNIASILKRIEPKEMLHG